jgi:hypothetical protein
MSIKGQILKTIWKNLVFGKLNLKGYVYQTNIIKNIFDYFKLLHNLTIIDLLY